ncbi:MAG TPA: O-antigen ligase family protein, partial [Bryobacteraceae bacterium]|nr:O-antigen ligase family protein [Bryobacteraceae bacterium]
WGGARLKLWRDSVRMASHRLAAGYGPEVFTGEFPRFESAELARAYPDFAHESPHNIFLDALVSQGLPGMLVLLGLCAAGLGAAVRGKYPLLAAALAAGIVSQQFTAFTLPTAVIFFTTLGLAISGKMPPGAAARPRIALKAAAIVTAAALFYLGLRFAVADHALALAQRGLNQGDIGYAAAEYRNYERWRLPGGSADLWYSRAVLAAAPPTRPPNTRLAALLESEKSALRATQTAEDPFNAWYNLAIIDAAREDRTAVERSLRAAIAAHPTWFKPHWTLAQLLRLEGRLQEARGEAERAADLDAGKDTPVMQTLDALRGPPAPVPAPTFQK